MNEGTRIVDFNTTSIEWKRGVLRGMLNHLLSSFSPNDTHTEALQDRAADYRSQLAELGG